MFRKANGRTGRAEAHPWHVLFTLTENVGGAWWALTPSPVPARQELMGSVSEFLRCKGQPQESDAEAGAGDAGAETSAGHARKPSRCHVTAAAMLDGGMGPSTWMRRPAAELKDGIPEDQGAKALRLNQCVLGHCRRG